MATAGVLRRHQTQPRGELLAILEILCRADRRHHGIRCDRTDPDDGLELHAGFIGLGVRLDTEIALCDAFAHLLPLRVDVVQQLRQ